MVKHVDSGGQVHLVTNIRKPRKWRRYEYLQSSGTQWIDTGIKTSTNTKFVVTIRLTSPTADSKFIGAYLPGGAICTYQSKWRIYSGNQFYLTDIDTNADKVNIEYSGNIFKVNNLSYTLGDAIAASDVNIFLFYADFKGSPTGGQCAIYEYKHYEGDSLVRHMVPAQYNGEYGLWDLVEDKFYKNKGTGAFTVGPEMKNYDEIDEVRKTSSLLPAGVELYDYIASTSTQWIDTGYIPNNNTKVILDFKQNVVTDGFFFGGRDAYSGSACFALHKDFAQFGSDMGSGYSIGDSLNRCIVTLSQNGIYIDSTLKHSYSSMSFTSPKTLKLFG